MGPAPHYFPVDFILACHATFLILINIFQFVFSYLCITSYKLFSFSLFSKIYFFSVRDLIRDPIRDPVYDSIQFDPKKKNNMKVNFDMYPSHISNQK